MTRLSRLFQKRYRLRIIFLATLTLLSYLCTFKSSHTPECQGKARRTDRKKILVWTKQQNSYDNWFIEAGPMNRSRPGCPTDNCDFSFDKGDLLHSDAVLLGLYDLKVFLILGPTISWVAEVVSFGYLDFYSSGLPPCKPKHQKWVLFWSEPPNILFKYTSDRILDYLQGLIDFTASFRTDSTIYTPYFFVIPKNTQLIDHFRHSGGNALSMAKEITRDFHQHSPDFREEEKGNDDDDPYATWFVSNCHAPSDRGSYARLLEQFGVALDVYGRCGPKRCPTGDCYHDTQGKYTFYLSFENEICEDYVTEKLRNPLMWSDMVPVVMGGADYSLVAPPQSMINVRDVTGPRAMAALLRQLHKSPQELAAYLKWKDKYELVGDEKIYLCELCAILHDETRMKDSLDFLGWWSQKKCFGSWINYLVAIGGRRKNRGPTLD